MTKWFKSGLVFLHIGLFTFPKNGYIQKQPRRPNAGELDKEDREPINKGHKMNKKRTGRFIALALLLAGLCSTAQAVTRTWVGSTSTNWADAANWSGAIAGQSASFGVAGTQGANLYNNISGLTLGGATAITFTSNSTPSSYIINGNSITLGGNITVSAGVTNAQVINLPMTLSAARTATVKDGATLTLGGPISGAFGFIKGTGLGNGGTLILTGTNTFTGDFTLGTGIIKVSSDESMGAGTNVNFVQNAKLTTTATFGTSKTITLAGNAANQDILPDAETTLTLNGAITGGNSTSSASMRLGGAGKIILAASNNYSATTTILGDVTLSGAGTIGTNNLSLNSGTLNLGGKSQTVGALSLVGASSLLTNGNITSASILVNNSSGNAIIEASLHGAGVTFTKTNNGIATLSGNNTYSGGTVVKSGTLIGGATNCFGTGDMTVGLAGSSAIATLTLNGAYMNDLAMLVLENNSVLNLDFTGNDIVGGIIIDGVNIGPGTFTSSQLEALGLGTVSGTGGLTVIPKSPPSVLLLFGAIFHRNLF